LELYSDAKRPENELEALLPSGRLI
jgi:hypothetical protein